MTQPECGDMKRLREKYDLKPLVIHTNYLVNLGSTNELFLKKSIEAFRGEIERALALCAEYLVLHPGSFRGTDRERVLRTAAAIAASARGLDLAGHNLTILIENTAGAEYSLGASFEQVAEVLEHLRHLVPVAACIVDTCHTHVAGYDIVSEPGMRDTLEQLDETIGLENVRVWHCNDAKAARVSKLDRHQHSAKANRIGAVPLIASRSSYHPRCLYRGNAIDEPGNESGMRNAEKLVDKRPAINLNTVFRT